MPIVRDFEVRISRLNGQYLGQVMASPAGHSPPEVLKTPFEKTPFELLRLQLENAVLRGSGRFRGDGPQSAEEKILKQFGAEMFDIVFRQAPQIARLFDRCRLQCEQHQFDSLRIKLGVDTPDLAQLPWEFMFDAASAAGYLCLADASPVLRHLGTRMRAPLPLARRINVLGMIANPPGHGGQLDVAAERERIDAAFRQPEVADRVRLTWVNGDTLEHLLACVGRGNWHVFHFIGHGGFDESDDPDAAEGYIVLGNGNGGAERVYAQNLAQTLGFSSGMQLAVLNCCESARGRGIASPGAALARAGIPAVIAMQYAIENRAATKFAQIFYQALANGSTIERALTMARVGMFNVSKVEWGIPVLFSNFAADESIQLLPERSADEFDFPTTTIAPDTRPMTPAEPVDTNPTVRSLLDAGAMASPPIVTPPSAPPMSTTAGTPTDASSQAVDPEARRRAAQARLRQLFQSGTRQAVTET